MTITQTAPTSDKTNEKATKTTWLIRAKGGTLIDTFVECECVAIGSEFPHELPKGLSRQQLQRWLETELSHKYAGKRYARELAVFAHEIQPGDTILTPAPYAGEPVLRVGIVGDYRFDQSAVPGYPHVRYVNWTGHRIVRGSLEDSEREDLDRFRNHALFRITNSDTIARASA